MTLVKGFSRRRGKQVRETSYISINLIPTSSASQIGMLCAALVAIGGDICGGSEDFKKACL